jgi:site-specific DNA-cytosine methylase
MKFIDLFCGIGGFRIAFESESCECVFSSDIDKYARETYFNNFNEYPLGDIKQVDEKKIPKFEFFLTLFKLNDCNILHPIGIKSKVSLLFQYFLNIKIHYTMIYCMN